MTLEQLGYALAVFQHGSFVRAAEQSFVTQPALTIQIKNLEDELGIILFDRTKKPVLVTEEGRQFLEKAQEIVLGVKDLQQMAQQLQHSFQGEIKLGIIITLAPYLVPLFVSQFTLSFPQIHLQIIELRTEEILEGIRRGHLDAGIIATPVRAKGMLHEVLFYEKFFLYVSPQHALYTKEKISIDKVPVDDLWLLQEGNCFRNQVNDLCKISEEKTERSFTYSSSSIESLKRIVEHQGGLTFVPELATLNIPREKENMMKEIGERQPVREISLITHRAFVKRKLLHKLKDVLLDNIPASMKKVSHTMIVDTHVSV